MAATRLIALHKNKGKSVAACLKSRTDYAKNPDKTNKGELVSSYECSPLTADEEFMLSKRQYEFVTGRIQKNDVIAYQIRQSFKPGEITAEEANKVGYELAMRFTKGKYAFIVATHTDREHIHNHIIYNSTALDSTRKFRDFLLSGLAVQRLSDLICLEHQLSVIEIKPYRERQKRTLYPPRESNRDKLCAVIDNILLNERPANFEGFLQISKSLLVFKDFGYQLTTTKESNIRDVDVAPEYMDFLKEYYKYWKSQKKLMGGSWQKSLDKKSSKYAPSLLALRGTDFVICNDHGFPINPDSYGALVRRIGQRAGIEGLHPHMFRHTFVSILLSNPEIGVATVAAEAGHAQPSTTLAIYTQVYDKRRKEIRNQMSKELYE